MSTSRAHRLRAAMAFQLTGVALVFFGIGPLVAVAFTAAAARWVEGGVGLTLLLFFCGAAACWWVARGLRSGVRVAQQLAWVCAGIPAVLSYPLGWGIPVSLILFYCCWRAREASS